MPLTIRSLPVEVTSAIAAGEVVERPASVVKELLENSIDAGASRIDILVEEGGRHRIEVTDDGCGIPSQELALAIARYATSKLARVEDLFALRTLGFRGEALASIAAVSRMELISRSPQEAHGARLLVDCGRASHPRPSAAPPAGPPWPGTAGAPIRDVGAPPGTTVRVQDLFYCTPARLKFLRSPLTERRRIGALTGRLALAYPNVAIGLSQEGRVDLRTSGNGDRREILAALIGTETAKQMLSLPVSEGTSIRVTGFISPPAVHRSNRNEITIYVNGRWVQDVRLSAATVQAYHSLLMVGRFPLAYLFIELPAEAVDVNVHPAKAEVRFREPEQVFSVVQRVVRATLLGQTAPPAVTLPGSWRTATAGSLPDPHWEWAHTPTTPLFPTPAASGLAPRPSSPLPLLRAVGQVGSAFLVAEGPDGLYLIDQHAAHERVLFEALLRSHQAGAIESQALLEPAVVELGGSQANLLESTLSVALSLGFDVESFGSTAFRLRAVPALMARVDPEAALRALVEDLDEDEAPLAEEVEKRLAARVCKRAAIKSGQVLALAEQQELLKNLENCQSPRTCPHGRPTMIHLSVEALERQFGRRG